MILRRHLIVVAVAATAMTMIGVGPPAQPACASGSVGLVVRHSNSSVTETCVALRTERIDAIALLRGAGHRVATKDFGGKLGQFVCQIDGDGSPAGACPASDGHWHLWLLEADSRWAESIRGGSSTVVRAGDTVAWAWQGPGANDPPAAPRAEATCQRGLSASRVAGGYREAGARGPGAISVVAPILVAAAGIVVVVAARRRRAAP